MKLDVVEIRVGDWDKMVNWYTKVLGLKVLHKEYDDKFAILKDNEGMMLALYGGEQRGEVGNITPYWRVTNIEEKVKQLKERGVEFSEGIEVRHWGKQAEFIDPEENRHFLYQEKTRI